MQTKLTIAFAALLLGVAGTSSVFGATQILGSGFVRPYGMQLDASGNLYVADSGNDAVKRATAADGYSTITTLGGGFAQPKGIALDASGNVYVADSGNNAVAKMAANCASSACVTHLGGGFNAPLGIALDATGAVYVADAGNHALKKIPLGCASAACVQTVGSGFATPSGVALDGQGNLFVADAGLNDATHSGVVEIRASDNAQFGILDDVYQTTAPSGIAVDAAGDLYVTDAGGLLSVAFAVNGGIPASGATLLALTEDFSGTAPGPRGVALDANENVYIADTANDAVKALLAVPVAQRTALKAIYLATIGNQWADNSNWCDGPCPLSSAPNFNSFTTECSWHGVGCNASGTQVTVLDLSYNRLSHSLPSLQALRAIEHLDFTANALVGNIPPLAPLQQLQSASFAFNRFGGSVPSLSGLSHLTFLLVDFNLLSGPLPDFTGLSQLQTFDATGNGFTGALPDFSTLPALRYFAVSQNQLSGSVPSVAGLGATLQVLYLDQNDFSGALPDLSALPNLVGFSAAGNRFSGSIPSIAAATGLTYFDVDSNLLTGSVPSLAGLALLNYASFAGNQLTGGFPDLTGAAALAYLDLSSNQLSGPLPDLSAATAMHQLHLQSNRFSGSVPVAAPNLFAHQSYLCPNLLTLDASANDAAWNAATGQTPWWGPLGAGCDGIARSDFEQLSNGSFEHGISGWHIGSGTCLWETASEGVFTAGFGAWPAPTPQDGSYTLVSDGEDLGICTLYQDATVPTDASHANLSAAVGYNISGGDPSGCSVALSVLTPAGALISPYVAFSGGLPISLTQYAPATFAVQPGEKLRVQVTIDNECPAYPAGIELDNVDLSFTP